MIFCLVWITKTPSKEIGLLLSKFILQEPFGLIHLVSCFIHRWRNDSTVLTAEIYKLGQILSKKPSFELSIDSYYSNLANIMQNTHSILSSTESMRQCFGILFSCLKHAHPEEFHQELSHLYDSPLT